MSASAPLCMLSSWMNCIIIIKHKNHDSIPRLCFAKVKLIFGINILLNQKAAFFVLQVPNFSNFCLPHLTEVQ